MKGLFIGVAAAAAMFVSAASASAHVFTINGDWKMGSFAVKRDGTLRGAIDAFGRPGDKNRNGAACVVRWPRHGLKIHFYNLGGQTRVARRSGSSHEHAPRARTGGRIADSQ